MVKYRRLNSILLKDNIRYAVDLYDWAKKTLEGSELEQFELDATELLEYFKNQIDTGNLIINNITEEITTDHGKILIPIGVEFSVTENYTFPEKEIEWYNRMALDPNIVKFNDKELISEE